MTSLFRGALVLPISVELKQQVLQQRDCLCPLEERIIARAMRHAVRDYNARLYAQTARRANRERLAKLMLPNSLAITQRGL